MSANKQRDAELLGTLTHRVRLLSMGQIARTWWPEVSDAMGDARRRVASLAEQGLLETADRLVHPEVDSAAPLATWQPALPLPEFDALAYQLERRWSLLPRRTTLVFATAAAANQLGGFGGRAPRTSEATHDTHLSAVYLRMRRETPTRARSWRSEAWIVARRQRLRFQKVPDAIVRDGRATTAIEFGGEYAALKLAEFHAHCARHGWGYEIW